MKNFEMDSLNGLLYRMANKVSELVTTKEQQKDIQEIMDEIAKRVSEQDEEIVEVIDILENLRGNL